MMRVIRYIQISEIFLKRQKNNNTRPSDIWRDNDLHGIMLHLKLKNFQGKEST